VADDVVVNKVAAIERCLARVRALYANDPHRLEKLEVEEGIVLNLLRACEASIDLAMHLVASERLGVPQHARQAFELLEQAAWIEADLSLRMQRMIGFRNIAVHEYQKLDREIMLGIVRERLGDFEAFATTVIRGRAGTKS
jgi:uncharacterized protein YutE (UPF0331/DUF86 family)